MSEDRCTRQVSWASNSQFGNLSRIVICYCKSSLDIGGFFDNLLTRRTAPGHAYRIQTGEVNRLATRYTVAKCARHKASERLFNRFPFPASRSL